MYIKIKYDDISLLFVNKTNKKNISIAKKNKSRKWLTYMR